MTENLLRHETSPYLLQHADNPVHWQPWNPETLALAQREGKPILLSVGYAACHWCHVMAHESFEDPAIAAVMNDLYVNVKVDREERPDIDMIYQQALSLLGEQGGWPLTMFLTPDGAPFWGGTYFPSTARYGRPGFPDVLRQIESVYRQQNERVAENVGKIAEALAQMSSPEPGAEISIDLTEDICRRLVRQIDPFHGGIGGAPKFPQPSLFLLLWRAWQRTGLQPYREAVSHSLAQMCQGGIYDHLGGGFARYATDEAWLIPHFEKMLYDNGLLLELMAIVAREDADPLLRTRITETVDWALREMVAENGAFAASYDADSEGEEGKFYVWDKAEIDTLLADFTAEDRALFHQSYGVGEYGNWEGKTILNRSHALALADDETERKLLEMRAVLLAQRNTRIWPGWDDKVLADWNGLMITGLVEAAITLDRPDWITAARTAFDAICRDLGVRDGALDRLRHAWRKDRAAHPASAEDLADMAKAGIKLFEATGEVAPLVQARRWVETLDARYWDAKGGGYFTSADDTTDVIQRTKSAMDNAVPSANGVMAEVLARLFLITGETAYRERAEALIRTFAGEIAKTQAPLACLLNGNELLRSGRQVVVVGGAASSNAESAAGELHRIALASPGPDRVVQRVSTAQTLASGHPAAGKEPVDGKATAYVCDGPVCSLPITDGAALAERLMQPVVQTHSG